MKYLMTMLMMGALVAAAPADEPTSLKPPVKPAPALTPEKLGEMLTDLALEPKDISAKGGKDVYQITSERAGHKLFLIISLSTDRSLIWFELKTVAVPDPKADLGDAWYRLLKDNADITPAFFSHNPKDKRNYLWMTIDNVGVTPAIMRTNIDRFDGFARQTSADWDPKRFRPMPVVPTLSEDGKAFLAKLEGTWEQVGEEIKGKKSDPSALEQAAITYTFTGGKVRMKSAHGTDIEAQMWAASGTPGQIDFYFMSARSVEKGIVKLEGDTMTVCMSYHGVERPKEFATTPDFAGAVRVFKRKK